jgi:hypothetical protein
MLTQYKQYKSSLYKFIKSFCFFWVRFRILSV